MSFTDAFTVGSDVAVDLYDPQDGSLTRIPGITGFNAKPMTKDLEHHGLNLEDRFASIYTGWELTFDYDRLDGTLDRYFAAREARYRSGLPSGSITITETITERDGSFTQFRYSRVEIKQDDRGNNQREEKVTGKVTGRAGKRELVQ